MVMPIFLITEPRCVFAHIPKTGGNSIRNVFFDKRYEGPWFGDALPEGWEGLFKFAFVRNPFDRVVSAWKMFCDDPRDGAWELEKGILDLTLEEVLQLGLDDNAAFGHPWYNQITPTPLIRLKNHILHHTHPYLGLQYVDFIGRFETLQQDFDHVMRQLDLPPAQLPKSNWTRRTHYREYFDDQIRQMAEDYYRDEIERFGYTFE